jgi:hypothetical protein
VTRATCHAALGLGCVASAAFPVRAAEWSFIPLVTLAVDDDSNRYLLPDAEGSQSTWLFTNLQFELATESMQLWLAPQLRFQHFDAAQYTDITDVNLNTSFTWTQERGQLSFTGGVADNSTLTTELSETGIANTHLHRRTEQGALSWTYGQTELRSLVLQLAYTDLSYYGPRFAPLLNLLLGYRYPSASVGEQFTLSPRSTLTVSAFGDALQSSLKSATSHEAGAQVELVHSFSERTKLDVSGGASARTLEGQSSTGTVASVDLTHTSEVGSISLDFLRRLAPYGTGGLVQRQQYSIAATRNLSERLSLDASAMRINNNKESVLLDLARPNYTGVTLGLNWQFAEGWKLRHEVGGQRAPGLGGNSAQYVDEWRTALTLTWTPYPRIGSF